MGPRLDAIKELQSRPARTLVPAINGLSYENAETKLRASNLNMRLLARYVCHSSPDWLSTKLHNLEGVCLRLICRRYYH
jgi:hypothetical protein